MVAIPTRSPDRALRSLQGLPGIGASLAGDLARLGYREPEDLTGEDPEKIFRQLEAATGVRQDPLVLDAFRCACHSASSLENDRELVKPWAWTRLRAATPREPAVGAAVPSWPAHLTCPSVTSVRRAHSR